MLLNKSQQINTIAWLPDAPPTVLPTLLYFSGSSEYNQNPIELVGDVISTTNTPYLIAQISASYIPDASGWYIMTAYKANPDLLIWDDANTLWQDADETWESSGVYNDVTYSTIRVFVSGSNDPQFIKFISNNETGSFNRYTSGNETANFTRYASNNESGSFTRYYSANESGSFTRYISPNERGYYITKQN